MGCCILRCKELSFSILSNVTGYNRLQSSDQTYPSSQVSTHMAAVTKASTIMTTTHKQIEQLILQSRYVQHVCKQLT